MNESIIQSIPQRFEEQARKTPHRVALEMQGRSYTFRQVDERANQLAHALRARGVGRDVLVGVHLCRSPDAVCAILAILKTGGAYVPVDPLHPVARKQFIVSDSNMALLITEQSEPELGVPVLDLRDDTLDILDRSFTCSPAAPNDIMYILYTSGSTGVPKGVCGIHGATMNRFAWMWKEFPFVDGEINAHRTQLSFLDSLWEMFGPLLQGIKVFIVSQEDGANPHRSISLLHEARITRVTVVPSLLNAFLQVCPNLGEALPAVTTWISSGERLPARLLERFFHAMPHATLLNLYGSTEVAGDATCAVFRAVDTMRIDPVAIGKPIDNVDVHILAENGQPLPVGEVGELYIGGPVLARGYHCRPDDEQTHFVPNPFKPGERLFRTGDRVRTDADGTLYCLGRTDNQVKIRGFRIELEEVENVLQRYPGPIEQVGAVVHQDGDDLTHRRLVVFVTPKHVDTHALGQFAASQLPPYMVPSRIIAVDALPLTSTGKLDRLQLAQMRTGRTTDVPTQRLPRTPTECLLAALWANRLGVWPVSTIDRFLDLGGDSLSLVAFFTELRARVPEVGAFDEFIGTATLESLAMWIDERRAGRDVTVTSFLTREPMMVVLAPPRDVFAALVKQIAEHCLSSGLSFVAVDSSDKRMLGFCLGHDHAVRQQASAPGLPPDFAAFLLMLEVTKDYRDKLGNVPLGELWESSMTGARDDVDGFGVAIALERRALALAKEKGFRRAMSLCTNRVTVQIAVELGYERVASMPYASFEVGGRAVFAGIPAQEHGEAVLFEKWL